MILYLEDDRLVYRVFLRYLPKGTRHVQFWREARDILETEHVRHFVADFDVLDGESTPAIETALARGVTVTVMTGRAKTALPPTIRDRVGFLEKADPANFEKLRTL